MIDHKLSIFMARGKLSVVEKENYLLIAAGFIPAQKS
jgi:hypothetical protein